MAAITFGLVATTFHGHIALGDAPESAAGIESVGVLHAPGYPTYVLVGRLFTWLFPVGDLAFRVNLLSLVCASATVALVYLVARQLGAHRWGGVLAALTLATGTSFWFYAGFAKHYALSGLLVAGATLLAAQWGDLGGRWRLATAGAVVGVTAGASWQLALLAVPGLVVLVLASRRRLVPRELVLAPAAAVLLALAVYGFLFVRAQADPAMNWGDADTARELVSLVTMEDFGFGASAVGRSETSIGKSVDSRDFVRLPKRLANYGLMITREQGVVAVGVAVAGLVSVWRWRAKRTAFFLTTALTVNLVAAGLVVGLRTVDGFDDLHKQGGFLTGTFIAVALAVGLGLTWLTQRASDRGAWAPAAVSIALGVGVVLPSLVVHGDQTRRREPAFADAFGHDVLRSLPRDAVLLVWGAERGFPMQYRQVVHSERRDVDVISMDGLGHPSYREQIERRLGVPLPPTRAGFLEDVPSVVMTLVEQRPVFIDLVGAQVFRAKMGYRPHGLVGEVVVTGFDRQPVTDVDGFERLVRSYETKDLYDHPFRTKWPNEGILRGYARMHLELARIYAELERWDDFEEQLELTLAVDPDNELARGNLETFRREQSR